MTRLYTDLASWWPVMSAPADYADEARLYARVIEQAVDGPVESVLELGSGGGNTASHLKEHFTMTLADLSPAMLDVSRQLNPECEHVEGDMRTVRLGRTFDAVFVHDAVMYMTTEPDLRAAIESAYVHVRPGGGAVFVPDETTETFVTRTEHGGHDADDRSLRYLEWTHPAEGDIHRVSFVFLLKEGDGPVRVEYDEHVFGVFGRDTWLRLLSEAGFEPEAIRHSYGGSDGETTTELFVGRRPR